MKPEGGYHHFVQWSEEDQCYIGYCLDLYFGGVCHADGELEACNELCTIIHEEVAHRLAQGQTLPTPAVKATRALDFVVDCFTLHSHPVEQTCQKFKGNRHH